MQAALELKKQADAGVLNLRQESVASVERLEDHRVQLQNVGLKLEQAAGHAIQAAVRKYGGKRTACPSGGVKRRG